MTVNGRAAWSQALSFSLVLKCCAVQCHDCKILDEGKTTEQIKTQKEGEKYTATSVLHLSHHERGLQGAAWGEMLFAWLEGVAYGPDRHTPGRKQQFCVMTVLQHPEWQMRQMTICLHAVFNRYIYSGICCRIQTSPYSVQSTRAVLHAEYWAAWGHRSL